MITIHDLTALVAVADSGSVRQAAMDLSRTQPAISQAIQRIEEDIGFTILDRSNYRATLTDRGILFLKRARALVKQAKDLQSYADMLHRDTESLLRVSVHGAVDVKSWTPLFAHLPEEFPNTVLEIQVGEGAAPLRQLSSGAVDFAITIGSSGDTQALDLNRESIGKIQFVNVIAGSKPIDSLEEDLAMLPQILVADFNDPEAQYGVVEGHRYWRVSNFAVKVALIVSGLGWGSVPKWMVEQELASGILQSIVYRGLGQQRMHDVFLSQRQQTPLGPVATSIWQQCLS